MNARSRVVLIAALCPWPGVAQVALPDDVARYTERRDLCDHFRGEEAYDAERRRFLEARMREFCTGADRTLKALQEKYKADRQVRARLDRYEARIEATSR
jgi:hypothetical protein